MPIWRTASIIDIPWPCRTSTCRSFDMLSSSFSRFPAVADPPICGIKISQLSDHFQAATPRDWITAVGAKTTYIEPGSPWESGCCERFNAKFRDAFLNGEISYSLQLARSPNSNRALAYSLQHRQATQLIGLSPTCARKHHSDRPEAHDALIIRSDNPMGARQFRKQIMTDLNQAVPLGR